MVLVQIYVTAALNGTYFDVPLYGTYDVNLLNISYHDGPVLARPMLIQSDILRCPNSNVQGIMFINQPHTNMTYNGGAERMVCFPNCDFNGKVLINLIDRTTNVAPVGMQYLLITLEAFKK
jgi:hypothetical protein